MEKRKYHILSGDVRILVEAKDTEDAMVEALKWLQLDRFGLFMACWENGKKFEDGNTKWGLTEWYLDRAGYRKIGANRWKEQFPRLGTSLGVGSERNREFDASISTIVLQQAHTSKIDSSMPLKQDTKPHKQSTPKPSKKLDGGNMIHPVRKVDLQRTPEEWAKVLSEAKREKPKELGDASRIASEG